MTAVMAQWRACCEGEAEAIRPLLEATGEQASVYPHPTMARRSLPVRKWSGEKIVVQPVAGIGVNLDLTVNDLLLYRLDFRKLCRLIGKALGLRELRESPEEDESVTVVLGELSLAPGLDCPVHWSLARTRKQLKAEVLRLVLEPRPGIVLTSTERLWTHPIKDLLSRHKWVLGALKEMVDATPSGWASTPAWQALQEAVVDRIAPSRRTEHAEPYAFVRKGQMWVVTFEGRTTYLADARGPSYLACLLASPHRKISAPDLLVAVTGRKALAATGSAGEQADAEAMESIRTRYFELNAELERAEADADEAAQIRIQKELDQLTDYIKSVKGLGGRLRKASDDADKNRRSITQAIKRTVDLLVKELPAAGAHLSNAIKTGLYMSYEPDKELNWTL